MSDICPMKVDVQPDATYSFCVEEDCAWWIPLYSVDKKGNPVKTGECAIVIISRKHD